MKTQKGFTLVELMIVVVIVGILASIGIPAYSDYMLRGKLAEATTELASMRVRLEQYYQDNRTYVGFDCTAVASAKYFTYGCPDVQTASAFTAVATGVATQGMAGFVYTINQNNAKSSTITAAGWTGNAACWATKKDGSC
jgi:type IV pilus assembly protein PilE